MSKHKKAKAIIQMLREEEQDNRRLADRSKRNNNRNGERMFGYTATILHYMIFEAERSLNE